ncbi:uroporphyrinogen-III C-methyltransferase [Paenibacillus crassostreae]|uniref:Uroporphyrinogen-III C-methyltransferase n=1 Tax=Paenibacillus crassostreae TaxID=1763538 RepID=A0A167AKG9_9BACL|nr:uroporphyrinogen-III C-methyltransferase [Paenibacillus crassostreae]AOZ94640.1 uroporphyrinogen-III C-methyltransferase [Paenibacillus crassostreae]OAB71135.1 uroporphyrin-III methyltransferase [Paenibacillus crassostreae]
MTGKVSIVGAGPGDPELLTVKALRRIESADVIMYDRLVNKEIVGLARQGAILVYCGKKPGAHTMSQDEINNTMITYALAGQHVVRLKGGDPFVFGRGGEEVLELGAYGIPYEIVPGITSAIGAAASAAIPLTHRGYAASFACVTGSRCHGDQSPVRWDLLAHSVDTLVVYMGVSELNSICMELIHHGKNPMTPVALIEKGTTKNERTFVGTLADIHKLAKAAELTNPALIIIGEVVRVREQLLAVERKAISLIG